MDDVLKKILDIKAQKGINDRDFARALKLRDGIVFDWKSGRSQSYTKYLNAIATVLNVAPSTFLDTPPDQSIRKRSGQAVNFDADKIREAIFKANRATHDPNEISGNLYYEETYDINECYLLRRFRTLNSDGRKKALSYMEDLSDNEKYTPHKSAGKK